MDAKKFPIYKGYDKIADSWIYGMPVKDADVKDRWWIMMNESDGAIIDDPSTIVLADQAKSKEEISEEEAKNMIELLLASFITFSDSRDLKWPDRHIAQRNFQEKKKAVITALSTPTKEEEPKKCPVCPSEDIIRTSEVGDYYCEVCGHEWGQSKEGAQERYERAVKTLTNKRHPLMGISKALRIAAGLEEGGEG